MMSLRQYLVLALLAMMIGSTMAQTQSPKRGMGLDQSKTALSDLQALQKGVSWFYSWSPSTSLQYAQTDIAFVPMTWNGGYNRNELRTFLTNHPEVEYLLAFNEPNFRNQANMTPSQAAAAWPALEAIADEFNLQLVSPAPNWCGYCVTEGETTYYSPYDWLQDFLDACTDCRVDYIGIHFYMGSKDAVKGSIDSLYNQFHKPIWLTEFNMDKNGMGDNGTVDEQRAFMVDMVDWMEQDPHVYRYAWFLMRGGILPDLMASTRGQLGTLGNVYAHMSSYDPNFYHPVNTRIEAEHYVNMSNVSLVESTDMDGNLSVGYTSAGSRLNYQIEIPQAPVYTLHLRTAGEQAASVNLLLDDTYLATVNIPSSGGWTTWQTLTQDIALPAGLHNLSLVFNSGSCDLNWLQLTGETDAVEPIRHNTLPVRKILRNGQLFIEIGEEIYSSYGYKVLTH